MELHGFADASLRAYGACIYLKTTNHLGESSVQLLCAKSRVSPTKPTRNIACLELCAAELLATLLKKIHESLVSSVQSVYLWTDSKIVLGWLSRHSATWNTFVSNRVSNIQELTSNATWRFVKTSQNPADLISRGAKVADLSQNLWRHGPNFLRTVSDMWPQVQLNNVDLPEKKKTKLAMTCTGHRPLLTSVYQCSNFAKNRRIFAHVLRFIANIRANIGQGTKRTGPFTPLELESAFLRIIWMIQQEQFSIEIQSLKRNASITNKSPLATLNPFIDPSSDLIHVGGRLQNAKLPDAVKCPIIVPKDNQFIKDYIRHLHIKHFHAGAQTLLNIVRQQLWIVNGRDYIRKVIRQCVHCCRYHPRLFNQIMGSLPKDRVTSAAAFSISGVDFCGPVMVTHKLRGRAPHKVYLAVFVCFVSKGIQLEVVSSLTTEACIAALKRFISRRTLCRHLYCDNGTNFVGARNQLTALKEAFLSQSNQDAIASWAAECAIEVHHIPPCAPHFGGLWEAAVKSAKTLLYKTLKTSILTYEELYTVSCQIEAIVNSRPLTPLSADPNEEQALTPAHFWSQAPMLSFPEPDVTRTSNLSRWQRLAEIQQHFWKRWSREYILSLQQRTKWKSALPNALEGQVVLVHDDNLPPMRWMLGRILQTITGKDGNVRVADVQTRLGVIRRPIHKLAPLPTTSEKN